MSFLFLNQLIIDLKESDSDVKIDDNVCVLKHQNEVEYYR